MESGLSQDTVKRALRGLDGAQFEYFVADLWEEDGWETAVTQTSNDVGVDVEAVKRDTIEQKLVIQTKRYKEGNKIGRPKIQQYYSLKEQDARADAAVVVTTSSFTDSAENWARDHNVKLVDGDDLTDLIHRVGADDLVREYVPISRQSKHETASPEDIHYPTILQGLSHEEPIHPLTLGLLLLAVTMIVQTAAAIVWAAPWIVGSGARGYAFSFLIVACAIGSGIVWLDRNTVQELAGDEKLDRRNWPVHALLPVIGIYAYLNARRFITKAHLAEELEVIPLVGNS